MALPNVLLVVLDSVRAANVGAYDYHRDTTPFLDGFAERSTLYTQARAPGIHSVASHASLWTGKHVASHGVVRHEDELLPETTVWENLADDGYQTGIFTTNPVVAHASNLADPFDERVTEEVVDVERKLFPDAHGPADEVTHEGIVGNFWRSMGDDQPVRSLLNNVHHFINQRRDCQTDSLTTGDVVDEFIDWRFEQDGPWAACLNLMDAHFPYEPAREFDQWGGPELQAIHADLVRPPANEFIRGRPWWQLEAAEHLYDGAIRQVDHHLRTVVSSLDDGGVLDETLVVVTSDHGEGFGEISPLTNRTRLVDHSWGIHEALTHVPLVVRYPGQTRGRRVEDIASLVAFPRAVEDVLSGEGSPDSFVPDGPVMSSTTRLREEDDGIFDDSKEDPEDYYGPWRAVYECNGGTVHAHKLHGDCCLEIECRGAGDAWVRGPGDPKRVTSAFDAIEPSDVKRAESGRVSEDVEEKLTDLGYLR